jgi:two-component system sensor histidine kinase KdpD
MTESTAGTPWSPAPATTAATATAVTPAAPAGRPSPPLAWLLGLLAWAAGWAAMLALDGRVDLANQALLLLLGGAVAALWLPAPPALALGVLSVAGFNWLFVPPRGTFAVDSAQNALLLGSMLIVNSVVALLMARLRAQAGAARHHQQQAEQLRQLGELLRDASAPLAHAGALQQALAALVGAPVALLLRRDGRGSISPDTPDNVMALGATDADEAAGLWHALRQGQAMGPGTGHHETLACWYLPLRGGAAGDGGPARAGGGCVGAALLRLPAAGRDDAPRRAHAQALCDQLGQALQRVFGAQAERDALAQAQGQAVRNALLAAISHDYRTPLATMLGAASSLADQGERLDAAQRHRLASSIVAEVQHLSRLTDNTLQLARLDAPGVALRLDWESAEEIVGTVLNRARRRAPERKLRARLEPGLPLLRCDALLLTQLLDNLVDNALNHTAPEVPVDLLVRREASHVVLAVRDRGPGVPPAWRERIFEVFQRGADVRHANANANADSDSAGPPVPPQRGAGVGLAVCRAIARAHGGELRFRARGHGGSSFECVLPLVDAPSGAPAADGEGEPR